MGIDSTAQGIKSFCYVEASAWEATLDEERYSQIIGELVYLFENQNFFVYISKTINDSYDFLILDQLEYLRKADLVVLLYGENKFSDQFYISLGHCIALGKPYLIVFLNTPTNKLLLQLRNFAVINLYRVISYQEFLNSPNASLDFLRNHQIERERIAANINIESISISDENSQIPHKVQIGNSKTSTYYIKYYDSILDANNALSLIAKRNSFWGVNLTAIPVTNTSIILEEEYPGVRLCDIILPREALLKILRQVIRFSCYLEEPLQIHISDLQLFTTELYSSADQINIFNLLKEDFWLQLALPHSRTRAFDPNPRNLIVNSTLAFVPVDFRTNFLVHPLSNIAQFLGYYPSLIEDGYKIINEERGTLGFVQVSVSSYLSALGQTFLRRLPFQLARSDLALINEFVQSYETFANENNLLYLIDGCLNFAKTKTGNMST